MLNILLPWRPNYQQKKFLSKFEPSFIFKIDLTKSKGENISEYHVTFNGCINGGLIVKHVRLFLLVYICIDEHTIVIFVLYVLVCLLEEK